MITITAFEPPPYDQAHVMLNYLGQPLLVCHWNLYSILCLATFEHPRPQLHAW